ncbi:hypothetical protein C9374_004746 [Naegleria lovaniensis]|uniref:PH domain-containing protein n=1 Tax=Naegleria lovaniensis TaxID=51637 RepID=A0AA88GPE3_NAELO|nr:uncharacterized protein C9374_004746 [Naegleria lovaniensis]KAG2382779.1 hypothetical protein C9374_004746 [Naegleria lovaniensis]
MFKKLGLLGKKDNNNASSSSSSSNNNNNGYQTKVDVSPASETPQQPSTPSDDNVKKSRTPVAPQVQEVSARVNNMNLPQKKKEVEIEENDRGVSERNKTASDVVRAERTTGDEALRAVAGLSDGLEDQQDELDRKKKKKKNKDKDNETSSGAGAGSGSSPILSEKKKKSTILGDLLGMAARRGYLSKRGGSIKTWHKRFFIVIGHRLYYYKDESPKNEPLGSVKCRGPECVQPVADSNRPYCFKIISEERTLYCQAESDTEMNSWITFLREHTSKLNLKKVKELATLQGFMSLLDNQTKKKKRDVYCLCMDGKFYILNSYDDVLPDRIVELAGASVTKVSLSGTGSTLETPATPGSPRESLTKNLSDFAFQITESIAHNLPPAEEPNTSKEEKQAARTSRSASSFKFRKSVKMDQSGNANSKEGTNDGSSTNRLRKGTQFFQNLVTSIEGLNQVTLTSVDPYLADAEIWCEIVRHEAELASTSWYVRNSQMRGWIKILMNNDEVNKVILQEKKRPEVLHWIERYACLVRGTLFYFVEENSPTPEGSIVLTTGSRLVTSAVRELHCPYAFKISSLSSNFYISVYSDDEKDCWVDELKEATYSQTNLDYNKYGWLTKQGGSYKSWKERFCVLKGTNLYYFADPNDSEPKGKVNLKGQMIRHLTPQEAYTEIQKDNVIKIYTSQRTWYFFADTMQDAVEWSIALRKAALLYRGRTWIVDDKLDGLDPKQSLKCKSISQAVAKAADLDRIIVYSGIYSETVVINKSVIIECVGDVVLKKDAGAPLIVDCSGAVKVSNMKITQEGAPKELRGDKHAVEVKRGNIMFEHCQILSRDGNGVVITDEGGVTMSKCRVFDCNHYGIWLNGKASAILENIEICGCQWDGLMLMANTDCIIRQSDIFNNSYNGIAVSSKGRLNVENCRISGNLWDGISINTDKGAARLFDNIIFDNQGFGIYYAKDKVSGINVDNEVYSNRKGQIFTLGGTFN